MIYISDMERVGFIIVAGSIAQKRSHRIYCNCDLNYNGECYKAVMCLYDNGKPATLYDVLGKTKEDAYKNLLFVKKLMARYTAANTNGLKDIAKSRFLLLILEIITLDVCALAIGYCGLCTITYGITLKRTIALILLFILFHSSRYIRIHYLRKLGI